MADSRPAVSVTGQGAPDVRLAVESPAVSAPVVDRRRQRTRAALLKAFVELLLERGYEALSVTQVADRADVGRSTLYEHFRTKDDLLKASLQGPFGVLAAAVRPDADARAVLGFLEHIRAHAAVGRLLLAQPLRSRIARTLAVEIAAALPAGSLPAATAELRAVALAEGQLALVERWLFGPVALPAATVADELTRLARAVARDDRVQAWPGRGMPS